MELYISWILPAVEESWAEKPSGLTGKGFDCGSPSLVSGLGTKVRKLLGTFMSARTIDGGSPTCSPQCQGEATGDAGEAEPGSFP